MFYKESLIRHFDKIAPYRPEWFQRNFIYHKQLIDTCRQFMGLRVLELGCSTGDLLNALKPKFGVGVDISPESIRVAKINYPELHWICADVETLGAKYPLLDK